MKKSMIAAAVVATAFAASANAGWFVISSASASGTTTGTLPGAGAEMQAGSAGTLAQPGSNILSVIDATDFTNIGTAIGLGSLATNTIHYFGMENSGSGPAFFGFAFKATGGSIGLNVNLNNQAGAPSGSGVLVGNGDGTTSYGSYSTVSGQFSSSAPVVVNSGDTLIVLFANLSAGSAVSGSISLDSGAASMGINYLSFNGSNYASIGGVTGATASQLNIATYAVPVPAPALLAGAGLVGAAALRRRMAKKA